MSYLTLLTQTTTRFYNPSSNGVDLSSYTKATYNCRWQNYTERFESASGEAWDSKAIVYSTAEFELDDWLFLGTTISTDPRDLDLAYRIKLKYVTQTPSADIFIYKYVLS